MDSRLGRAYQQNLDDDDADEGRDVVGDMDDDANPFDELLNQHNSARGSENPSEVT